MAKSPPTPELVEAYQLIKAGERQAAGQKLRAYLSQNRTDADGWWLMAHAVGKQETVIRCLETVIKLDPNHTKARDKLAKLCPPADDEPDDAMFFGGGAQWQAPAVTPPAPEPEPEPEPVYIPPPDPVPAQPGSFENYLAKTDHEAESFTIDDPFTTPLPPDDPFTSPLHQAFDPQAAAHGAYTGTSQAPGTGNQPDWGPGLGFVQEEADDSPFGEYGHPKPPQPMGTPMGFDDFEPETSRGGAEKVIGVAVIAVAVVVLVALIAYAADRQGVVSLSGDDVPALTTLDGTTFTINYPEKWDARCESEPMGYSICGIANDPFYNEVDWYARQEVDIGGMLSEAFSRAFTGSDLPDEQVSIIVMDVPPSSPVYDDKSWAKSQYEMTEYFPEFYDDAEISYDKQELDIDGYTAYYYEFKATSSYGKEAYYDVYIRHHDSTMTLWMFVHFWGERNDRVPEATITAMIESIQINEDW